MSLYVIKKFIKIKDVNKIFSFLNYYIEERNSYYLNKEKIGKFTLNKFLSLILE
jgi:hypothetical protein